MLNVKRGPWQGASQFKISATLLPTNTSDPTKLASLRLQDPYGNAASTGIPAGLIGKIISEGGVTVVALADASQCDVVIASSYADASQSGYLDVYWLDDAPEAQCYGNYVTTATYTVGQRLAYVPSGADQGKLAPATAYGSESAVAVVIAAPTNAANNTPMTVKFQLGVK